MKSGQETFDDALAALFRLAERHQLIFRAYNCVLAWLAEQPDERAARGRIGSMISLGYHLRNSPAIAERRNATRALLLVMATHFGASQRELNDVKRRVNASPDALSRNVAALLRYANRIRPGTGGSFIIRPEVYELAVELGTASINDTLRLGYAKAIELVNEAAWYVQMWGAGGEKFVRWFGELDDQTALTVRKNLQRMATALLTKPIDFSARNESGWGSALPQSYAQFQQQTHIRINLAKHFFDDTRTGPYSDETVHDPDVIDRVLPTHLALLTQEEDAIKQCLQDIQEGADQRTREAMLDTTLTNIRKRIRENKAGISAGKSIFSAAGVIIHETSHNVVKTTDVKVATLAMYGASLCGWLARHRPVLTIDNADTYRLFCEEFDD